MSRFLSELIVTPYPNTSQNDGVNWRLLQDFSYESEVLGATVTVPSGFLTDFASTPQATWADLPPWGRYGPAAVIHDWLYWSQPCTREKADAVLFEAMGELGVDSRRRWLIYEGVRAGGEHGWQTDAANRAAGKEHVS